MATAPVAEYGTSDVPANFVPKTIVGPNGLELLLGKQRYPVPVNITTATRFLPGEKRLNWRSLLVPLSYESLKLVAHLLLCEPSTRSLYSQIQQRGRPALVIDRIDPGLRDLPMSVWQCINDLDNEQRWRLAAVLEWVTPTDTVRTRTASVDNGNNGPKSVPKDHATIMPFTHPRGTCMTCDYHGQHIDSPRSWLQPRITIEGGKTKFHCPEPRCPLNLEGANDFDAYQEHVHTRHPEYSNQTIRAQHEVDSMSTIPNKEEPFGSEDEFRGGSAHYMYQRDLHATHPVSSNARHEAPPMPVFSNALEEPPDFPASSNCQVEAPAIPLSNRSGNVQSRPRAPRNDSYFRYD